MNEKNEDGEDLVNPYPKKGESGDRKSTVKNNVVGETTTSKGVHVDVQRILSQPMIDVIQLRDLLFKHGLPSDAHRERALCWRLLLDFLPFNREAWEPTLCDKRSLYEIYKNELPALSVPDIWQTSADDDDDDDEEGEEEAEDEKETTKKTDDKKLSSDDQRVEAGDQSTTILNSTNDNNENNSSVDGGSVSTTSAKPTTQDAKILDETKKTDVDAKNNHNAEPMQTNNSNSNNDSQSTQADQPCEEDKQVESDQEQSTQTKLKIEKNENDKNSSHAATQNNTDKTTLIQNDNDKDKSVDNNNDNENSNDGDDLKKKADATQQQQQQQQQPMVDESDELNLAFDLPSPPSDTAEPAQLETSSPLDANEESVCADLLPDVPLPSSSSNNNDNNASNSATDSTDVSPSLVLANEMEPSELERCVSCIDRDVPRTGRLVPALFGDGGAATEHAHAVRRILYMYSALNAGVGYTSGMHLLAAHIYCTLKRDASEFGTHAEADAFWLFSSLMSELISRHIVGLMADPSMAQHWPQYVCTAIKQRDPELSAKLDDSSLLGAASVWARTLFATMVAPTSDVPRLWDMLLAGQLGSSLLAATLGLLSLRRASLVNGTFAECTQLLNSAYAVAPLMAATRRTAAELAGTPGLAQRMARMQSTARDKFGALSDSARKKMRRLSAGGLRRTGTTDTTTTTNNNDNSNSVNAGGRPAGTWRRPDDLDEDSNNNNSNNSSNNDTSTDGSKSVQRKAETTASLERASAAALSFELPDVPTSVTQHSSVDTASATPPANTAQGTRRSGWAERQGHRPTMEDSEQIVDDVTKLYPKLADAISAKTVSFYGVYDGHAGDRAAKYCSAHLLDVLVEQLCESEAQSDESRCDALSKAFIECDRALIETSAKANWDDGSTGVVALQIDDRVYVANCGDAEIVVGTSGADNTQSSDNNSPASPYTATCLTIKHKPMDESERERIQAAGGFVIFGRVGGTLAVSRAFGDRPFKAPYSRTPADLVTVEPFTASTPLTEQHEFMVVACDGLYDVFSYADVADFVGKLKDQDKSPKQIAEELVDAALDRGSMDNVTAIVVFLKEPADEDAMETDK